MDKKDKSEYLQINEKLYRKNVAVVIYKNDGKVLFAKRLKSYNDIFSWQFPQGGIDEKETPEIAVLRELKEETGITSAKIVLEDDVWRKYDFPDFIKDNSDYYKNVSGQIQKWFLIKFEGSDDEVKIPSQEFSDYKWIYLKDININDVFSMKQKIYKEIIEKFTPIINDLIKNDM